MNWTKHVTVWVGLCAAVAALGTRLEAQPSAEGQVLVGTWLVHITGRDCDTGVGAGPGFHSVMTFTRDGAFFEQSGLRAFAPNQRTDGLGQWQHEDAHTFTVTSISVIAFETLPNPPSPGFLAGWSTLSQTIELNDSNHLTTRSRATFSDANGQVYRTPGCVIGEGIRFP